MNPFFFFFSTLPATPTTTTTTTSTVAQMPGSGSQTGALSLTAPGLPADFSPAGTPAYSTDINLLKSELKTPGQIISYIDQNFTWAMNTTNRQVYSPQQMDSNKVGMCADLAAFDAFFLNNAGYTANILHYTYVDGTGATDSHYVTLFEDNGTDWVMSNGSVIGPVTGADNLKSTLGNLWGPYAASISPIEYMPYNGNKSFAQQS